MLRINSSVRRAAVVAAASAATLLIVAPTARAEPHIGHAPSVSTTSRPADSPLLDACPLSGAATYEDSWGWTRSGGRRHEGVDMIADRGTLVTAVRAGEAFFKTSRLGGRAIWLTTDDGDKFYYAHLDDWAGDSRRVEPGEPIGWVGSTGNAHGPHLHFETHRRGNVENPFPHTFQACVPDLTDDAVDTDVPTFRHPDRGPTR